MVSATGLNGHPTPSSTSLPTAQPSAQSASTIGDSSSSRTPLSVVVTDAVKRWYVDTNKEAVKGDVVRIPGTDQLYKQHKVQLTMSSPFAEAASSSWTNAAGRLWM